MLARSAGSVHPRQRGRRLPDPAMVSGALGGVAGKGADWSGGQTRSCSFRARRSCVRSKIVLETECELGRSSLEPIASTLRWRCVSSLDRSGCSAHAVEPGTRSRG